MAGESLFERRQLENDAQDCGHRAVADHGVLIEDQVLQPATFDGGADNTMYAINRGDDPGVSRGQAQTVPRARADAHTTAQAQVDVQAGNFAVWAAWVARGDQGHGLNGAGADATPAPGTIRL